MLFEHVALVAVTQKLQPSELALTAAALQKQAIRDIGPIWGIQATVDYFPDLRSVPVGYWPIIIVDRLDVQDALGYHEDRNHQPYALVKADDAWQLTCSHELCEMLVDPYGRRLVTSTSVKDSTSRVQYLVEVCDPCEDASFAYTIDGILMSDFYTPHYFDPTEASGVRYSYNGSITAPRQIKPEGYLSWYDPAQRSWFQANHFGPALEFKQLDGMQNFQGSLRSMVDKLTKNPHHVTSATAALTACQSLAAGAAVARQAVGEDREKLLSKFS